jgi:amino acid transporter
MAELGSAAPTAGGLYYWTFQFSSPRYRKLLSWLIGCMSARLRALSLSMMTLVSPADVNTAAYISGVASVDWGVATQIMAAANIGTDGQFVATNAQV